MAESSATSAGRRSLLPQWPAQSRLKAVLAGADPNFKLALLRRCILMSSVR